MTVQEVARSVMKVTQTTQKEVSERAGLSGQGAISMLLQSKSMRVEGFLQILNACGYELVARSADGRTPEYVVGEALRAEYEAEHVAELEAEQKAEEDERFAEMIRKAVSEEIAKRVSEMHLEGQWRDATPVGVITQDAERLVPKNREKLKKAVFGLGERA